MIENFVLLQLPLLNRADDLLYSLLDDRDILQRNVLGERGLLLDVVNVQFLEIDLVFLGQLVLLFLLLLVGELEIYVLVRGVDVFHRLIPLVDLSLQVMVVYGYFPLAHSDHLVLLHRPVFMSFLFVSPRLLRGKRLLDFDALFLLDQIFVRFLLLLNLGHSLGLCLSSHGVCKGGSHEEFLVLRFTGLYLFLSRIPSNLILTEFIQSQQLLGDLSVAREGVGCFLLHWRNRGLYFVLTRGVDFLHLLFLEVLIVGESWDLLLALENPPLDVGTLLYFVLRLVLSRGLHGLKVTLFLKHFDLDWEGVKGGRVQYFLLLSQVLILLGLYLEGGRIEQFLFRKVLNLWLSV